MEIKIIKEGKYELEFEIKGEDHTFCNVLRHFLNLNKDVERASYKIEHPLLSTPVVYVKTKEIPLPRESTKLLSLTAIKGIGPKIEEKLRSAGIRTANALLKSNLDKVSEKSRISLNVLKKYAEEAKKLDFVKKSAARAVIKDSLKDMKSVFSEMKKYVE
jgi:DNA-directed RNA polymerase subunit L